MSNTYIIYVSIIFTVCHTVLSGPGNIELRNKVSLKKNSLIVFDDVLMWHFIGEKRIRLHCNVTPESYLVAPLWNCFDSRRYVWMCAFEICTKMATYLMDFFFHSVLDIPAFKHWKNLYDFFNILFFWCWRILNHW